MFFFSENLIIQVAVGGITENGFERDKVPDMILALHSQ